MTAQRAGESLAQLQSGARGYQAPSACDACPATCRSTSALVGCAMLRRNPQALQPLEPPGASHLRMHAAT